MPCGENQLLDVTALQIWSSDTAPADYDSDDDDDSDYDDDSDDDDDGDYDDDDSYNVDNSPHMAF